MWEREKANEARLKAGREAVSGRREEVGKGEQRQAFRARKLTLQIFNQKGFSRIKGEGWHAGLPGRLARPLSSRCRTVLPNPEAVGHARPAWQGQICHVKPPVQDFQCSLYHTTYSDLTPKVPIPSFPLKPKCFSVPSLLSETPLTVHS